MRHSYMHDIPSELLLKIFTLNANMFADFDALKTTYAATAVCKSWRDLLLATSSLWGKLIDFDSLWRHLDTHLIEILGRSQGSLLWVKHERQPYPPYKVERLERIIAILDQHWPRVQILALNFTRNPTSSDNFCNIFSLPAPNLHTFKVTYREGYFSQPVFDKLKSTTLFSGDSPNLHILKLNWFDIFNRLSPRVQGLHTVHIDNVHDVHGLLSLLNRSSSLRILIVNLIPNSGPSFTEPLPIVSLPHLLSLQLGYITSAIATVLFDHLDLPTGVPLHCRIMCLGNDNPPITWLSTFSRSYFKAYPPTRLLLDIRHDSIKLKDLSCPEDDKRDFSISISRSDVGAADMLDILSSPYLASTTTLRIEAWSPKQPPSAVKLLFAFLSGLTRIEVCSDALQYLVLALQKEFDFCPSLTACALTGGDLNSCYRALSFLQLRALAGRPLTVFDITNLKDSDITNAVRTLDVEELKDMRIRWKMGGGPETDYICGSDAPKLRLHPF